MDIFKLFKENKIESTIVYCNRNQVIHDEIKKKHEEFLSALKSETSENIEKLKIASSLLNRQGMNTYYKSIYVKK